MLLGANVFPSSLPFVLLPWFSPRRESVGRQTLWSRVECQCSELQFLCALAAKYYSAFVVHQMDFQVAEVISLEKECEENTERDTMT